MKRVTDAARPACNDAFCMFWLGTIVVLCVSGVGLAALTEHFEAGLILFCGGTVLAVVMWTFFLRAIAISAKVSHSSADLPPGGGGEGSAGEALPKDVIS